MKKLSAVLRSTLIFRCLFSLLFILLISTNVWAEEGGSGHYFPGSMASFADGVPGDPVFIARLNVLSYEGSIDATRALPVAGLLAAGLDVKSKGLGLTIAWAPKWDLGNNWSYAAMATIPWLTIDVSANVVEGAKDVAVSDSRTGLGDALLIPLVLTINTAPI